VAHLKLLGRLKSNNNDDNNNNNNNNNDNNKNKNKNKNNNDDNIINNEMRVIPCAYSHLWHQ
jgi:hypothetical protein